MGFFSTADRSPKPGQAGVDLLRNFQNSKIIALDERKQDFVEQQYDNKIQELALKQAREEKLYKTFRNLQTVDAPTVQQWQADNNVTSEEWEKFTPFIEQIEKSKRQDTLNNVSQTLYKQKDLSPEIVKQVYQHYGVTPDMHKDLDAMVEDLRSEKKFATKIVDGNKIKVNTRTGEETVVHKMDAPGSSAQAKESEKMVELVTTYLKPQHNMGGMYPGDMDAKSVARYQEDVNFMISRMQQLAEDPKNNYSSPIDAYDAVIQEYNHRGIWAVQSAKAFSSTREDKPGTVQQVKKLGELGVPPDVQVKALEEAGWAPEEINSMMERAAILVEPADIGVDIALIRNKYMPKEGGGVRIKGKAWIRRGDYLYNENVNPPQIMRLK